MKISTKGRYALRMLLDLAERGDGGFVSLKEIAERQNISRLYLEQIDSLLNTSDILRANRGKQGGYRLAMDPAEYTVGQILRITESNLAPVACLEDKTNRCDRAVFCKTLPLWKGFYQVINNYFDGITLRDLLDRHDGRSADFHVI